MKLTVAMLARQ